MDDPDDPSMDGDHGDDGNEGPRRTPTPMRQMPDGEYWDPTTAHRLTLRPPRKFKGQWIQAVAGGGRLVLPTFRDDQARLYLNETWYDVDIRPSAYPPEFVHRGSRHVSGSRARASAGPGPAGRSFRYVLRRAGLSAPLGPGSAPAAPPPPEEPPQIDCDWLKRNMQEMMRKSGGGGRSTLLAFMTKMHAEGREYHPITRQWRTTGRGQTEAFCTWVARQLQAMPPRTVGSGNLLEWLEVRRARGLAYDHARGKWVRAPGAKPRRTRVESVPNDAPPAPAAPRRPPSRPRSRPPTPARRSRPSQPKSPVGIRKRASRNPRSSR